MDVLDVLFAENLDETQVNRTVSETDLFTSNQSNPYLFSGEVSCARGSETNKSKSRRESVFSWRDTSGNKACRKKRLSFKDADIIDDEMFFPSDVGKEMILNDHQANEFTFQNNVSCTPCSSWKAVTSKSFPLPSTENNGRIRRVTVGEFIKRYSEPVSSLSDNTFNQKVNFGCDTSTPIEEKKAVFSYNSSCPDMNSCPDINETLRCLSLEYQQSPATPLRILKSLSPIPLYSVTPQLKKQDYLEDFNIGSTNVKYIKRLKAEEEKKSTNSVDTLPQTFRSTDNLIDTAIAFLPGSSTSFGFDRSPLLHSTKYLENSQQNDSLIEQWIVQPQELTLDVSGKGSRLLLISNYTNDLKFKIKFDLQLTNVCPLSGVLPAKGQIGLRVLVSRFIRTRFTEDTEDTVKITCGGTEKDICVKIRKEQRKNISKKERSYVFF